jgi:hypothetical protein
LFGVGRRIIGLCVAVELGAATSKPVVLDCGKLRRLAGTLKPPGEFFSATWNKLPWSDLSYTLLGMGMSPREVIACDRLYAACCLEIAQEFDEVERKIALLNMAQTWIALADQIERAEGATRGIPHPSDEP